MTQAASAVVTAPGQGRIPSLDGLRAISISLVFLGHAVRTFPAASKRLDDAGDCVSLLGVTVFFAISGFLITTLLVAERRKTGRVDLRAFFRRRVVRIMPAAYALIAIVLCFGHASLAQMLLATTYTTSYAFEGAYRPLQHLWSLSVEEQFYLLWPLAVVGGVAIARRTALVVVIAEPIVRLVIEKRFAFVTPDFFHPFPFVADSLAYGCLLALYPQEAGAIVRRLTPLPIVAAAVVAFVAAGWFGLTHISIWTAVPALAALLVAVAVERQDALLNAKPVVFVGVLSYSLYLWQQPFMTLDYPFDYLPVRLALSFAAGYLSYRFIELPAIARFGHKRLIS